MNKETDNSTTKIPFNNFTLLPKAKKASPHKSPKKSHLAVNDEDEEELEEEQIIIKTEKKNSSNTDILSENCEMIIRLIDEEVEKNGYLPKNFMFIFLIFSIYKI